MLLICLPPGSHLSSRSSKSTSPRPAFRSRGWGLGHSLGSHQRRVLLHLVGGFALPQGETVSATLCQNKPPLNQAKVWFPVPGSTEEHRPGKLFLVGTNQEQDRSLSELNSTHQSAGNILETGSNTLCRTHTQRWSLCDYCNACCLKQNRIEFFLAVIQE